MRHVFLINPHAGKQDQTARIRALADRLAAAHNLDCRCLLTDRPGGAEVLSRALAETGEPVRIYACGGDGTVHEAANGIAGFPNAAMTVIPAGTGNDFLKNFGIDARIADTVHRYGNVPGLSGRGSYLLSVAVNFLFKPIGRRWRVELDGEVLEDDFALVSMCNGRYYGGGSMPVPEARMDDGVLETILVKNVPKRTFARLFPAYSAGEYWKFPHIARMVTSRQVVITASPGEADIVTCLDGESLRSREVRLVLAEKRVNFFGPKGCSPNATAGFDRKPRKRRYSTAFLLL